MAAGVQPALALAPEIAGCALRLVQAASLEISSLEVGELAEARDYLRHGQRIYVSHLPRQTWDETFGICARIASAGLDPIPHIPVRLLSDEAEFRAILRAAFDAGVREPLLLSGDYAQPRGKLGEVLATLRSDALPACGFTRVSFAGHPEGHPAVPARVMHQAQIDKWRRASELGLQTTFVTQFFFAARPFTQWACELRSAGVRAGLVAGLAGPTGITKLLRLAKRCGVGPSLRSLTSRPAAMLSLLADHDPDGLVRDLALEWHRFTGLFDGIHLFSLGGFLRTASWLRRYAP